MTNKTLPSSSQINDMIFALIDYLGLIQEQQFNKWEPPYNLDETSVACAVGPSVTMSSTDFSIQNQNFRNLFEFSVPEIT